MHRRTLLRAGAGLATASALAGCLAPVSGVMGGAVRPSGGQAVLHPAATRLVEGGLGGGTAPAYYATLLVSPPETDLFVPGASEDDVGDFRRFVEDTDFDSQFVLVVEARTPLESRVQLAPGMNPDPEWIGWRRLRLPIRADDATHIDAELVDNADMVTSTALVRFESGLTPAFALVTVYDPDGSARTQLQARPRPASLETA